MSFTKYLGGSLHCLYLVDPFEEFPPLHDSHSLFENHTDKSLCASLFSLPTLLFKKLLSLHLF